MSDAVDIGQAERLDHGADVLGKIQEVIAVGGGLVAVTMAAAVERIDGVIGCEFAGDIVPDLGDEAGAVQQKGRRLARTVLAPPRQRDARVGRSDRNSMWICHGGSYRASARIIAAPFSAIIAVGVLVLPEVMVGMTEASTTRSLATP